MVLEGVDREDFSSLLWVFYKRFVLFAELFFRHYSKHHIHRDYGDWVVSADKWRSILRLAHMWRFDAIRFLSAQKLGKLDIDAIEKLELSRRYELPYSLWSSDAKKCVSARDQPLSNEEARRIGLETSMEITRMREERINMEMTKLKKETERATKNGIMGHERNRSYNFPGGSVSDEPGLRSVWSSFAFLFVLYVLSLFCLYVYHFLLWAMLNVFMPQILYLHSFLFFCWDSLFSFIRSIFEPPQPDMVITSYAKYFDRQIH
jgi:hypothetical protein